MVRSLANQGSSLLKPQYDSPVGLGNEWYNILLNRENVGAGGIHKYKFRREISSVFLPRLASLLIEDNN